MACAAAALVGGELASARAADADPAAPVAVPAYRQADTIAVLKVEGIIDRVTLASLERRIAAAQDAGAQAIVLDIDTPGGELTATLDICNLLKDRSETPANTVAWINDTAYSAGTIIALACREIVVAPNSTFGDAAVVTGDPIIGLHQLAVEERAKLQGPILREIVESAREKHYDEHLVQAFVRVRTQLWLIRNVETDDKLVVNAPEIEALFGDVANIPSDAITPGARGVLPRHSDVTMEIDRIEEYGELPPAERTKQEQFIEELKPIRTLPPPEEAGDWEIVGRIVSSDELLTLKPDEAKFYGLATATIANDDELKQFFGAKTLLRYNEGWTDAMVRFLIHPVVRLVLIVIFLVSLFIELAAPGLGVFGGTALIALLLLVGAPAMVQLAEVWEIILIGAGIVLILAELFVIPGFGVAGLAGAACLLVGMVATFVGRDLSSPASESQLTTGIVTTITALFLSGAGIWVASRFFHTSPLFRRLMLTTELAATGAGRDGLRAGESYGVLEAIGQPETYGLALGDQGTATTTLRPAGRARFGDTVVDVQSVGSFIEAGTPVVIVNAGRHVIEVDVVDEDSMTSPGEISENEIREDQA